MAKYINKSALVAEIEKLQLCTMDEHMNFYSAEAQGEYNALSKLESFLDTLEVKDANEALRTEYEKGRADVIVEIEKCYEKAITAEAQAYLIKDLLDRLKTKKQV